MFFSDFDENVIISEKFFLLDLLEILSFLRNVFGFDFDGNVIVPEKCFSFGTLMRCHHFSEIFSSLILMEM